MNIKNGKVILAGAGPGDAELITVKLQRRLAEADIILTDRLVNPEIIELFANTYAEVIMTGKQGYNQTSHSQNEINEIMVEHALKGKTVLRLKGGDVAFFSNILDELIALEENNIEFEIIPGITAASGASASTGIPLTARGYSKSVQFLTYNPNSSYAPEAWKYFATCNDTLVFYMAAKNIIGLAEIMLRFTRQPNTGMALIEQATTVHQKVHITSLKNCEMDFKGKQFSSPSLVIIGNVVNFHNRFNWMKRREETGSVFKELV